MVTSVNCFGRLLDDTSPGGSTISLEDEGMNSWLNPCHDDLHMEGKCYPAFNGSRRSLTAAVLNLSSLTHFYFFIIIFLLICKWVLTVPTHWQYEKMRTNCHRESDQWGNKDESYISCWCWIACFQQLSWDYNFQFQCCFLIPAESSWESLADTIS